MIKFLLIVRYYFYLKRSDVKRSFNEWLLWEYGKGTVTKPRDQTRENSLTRQR